MKERPRSHRALFFATAFLLAATLIAVAASGEALTPIEQLGKAMFFDTNLSTPPGQSCATCHAPEAGFVGPDSDINAVGAVYPGAIHKRFGNRKPPTSTYTGFSPVLYFDEDEGLWIGGMFWDGRATGWTLGDPIAEQAQGPFLNPVEQNNPNARLVCVKVAQSDYADLFEAVWGYMPDCQSDVATFYDAMAFSIAAFERSEESDPFTSKFDYWLAGQAELTDLEQDGLEVFEGKAMCSACHLTAPGPEGKVLFTDFTYDNLGVPKNPDNPWYDMPPAFNPDGADWIDYGLGAFLEGAGYGPETYEPELGKVKVPTLRNVDAKPYDGFVKAFAHNGYFKSLEEIVHFYNTRDVLADCADLGDPDPGVNCWPAAEVPMNVNTDELGNLGLSADEEAALVAFMKTLTDGYVPE